MKLDDLDWLTVLILCIPLACIVGVLIGAIVVGVVR